MNPFLPRLVLAHYYPWYTIETWRDPQMADRPLRLYSTEAQADVSNEVAQAHAAGIDAFVVSWQGLDAHGGFNDRRMRIVLEAARASPLRVCVYTETFVANPGNNPTAADRSADDVRVARGPRRSIRQPPGVPPRRRPAGHLHLPASRLAPVGLGRVMARLRATGRNPFLVGDFVRSTLLDAFDGEYQYTNVSRPGRR